MRDTKSKSSALERKRFIFLEIGIIIALAVVLMAFNYRSYHSSTTVIYDGFHDNTIEQLIPITMQPPEPPPPAPQPPTTLFNIVIDGIDVEKDFIINVEDNQQIEIEDYEPFVPEEETLPEPELPFRLDKLPDFPGGDVARMQFLRSNLEFPESAVEIGISGTVYIQFVVEPDGRITNIKAVRGPGGGLNQEALRVAQLMPKWEPGLKNGKPVRVLFTMPITFVLQ